MSQVTKTATAITAATGEFYVAYRCSELGFVVAIPRANVPSIDLLVSNTNATRSVSIQVKTSKGAGRTFAKDPSKNRYEFDVGEKGKVLNSPNLIYVFVDLDSGKGEPRAFIVSSADVHEFFNDGVDRIRYMIWIPVADESRYLERWELISDALTEVAK